LLLGNYIHIAAEIKLNLVKKSLKNLVVEFNFGIQFFKQLELVFDKELHNIKRPVKQLFWKGVILQKV
jgi:hypothetical protein